MDRSETHQKFSDQESLEYTVRYEEECKRKDLRREGSKFHHLRNRLGENLPNILQTEKCVEKGLDQLTNYDLNDRF